MKRWMVLASCALFAATSGGLGHAEDDAARSGTRGQAADDTGRNVRDRDDAARTAGDQSNDADDVRVTRDIRRAVTDDDSLSTNAHNVKIITIDGVVTLRGPVASDEERSRIEAMAQKVGGVKRIENHLEVSSR